jgi:hypothetical protein
MPQKDKNVICVKTPSTECLSVRTFLLYLFNWESLSPFLSNNNELEESEMSLKIIQCNQMKGFTSISILMLFMFLLLGESERERESLD